MDRANPFAQTPPAPEPIIAQVCRQLRAESGIVTPASSALVDGLVDRVVRELWSGRVKAFVSILALRETRSLLRVQHLLAAPTHAEAPEAVALPAAWPDDRGERPPRDRVAIGDDVRPLDWRDALLVDDDVMRL